jgi:cytidylate kinase
MGHVVPCAAGRTIENSDDSLAIPRVIAVDGPGASGKSTVGRRIAAKLGCPFLDTGAMYRALTWAALSRRIATDDAAALDRLASSVRMEVGDPLPGSGESCTISIDGDDVTAELRRPEVERAVSAVSSVPGVREVLVRLQREIAGRRPIVMAGRDIGTVVVPDADLKVYLEASVEERARRRRDELVARGREASLAVVVADLRRRDRIDSERDASPLRVADDAVIVQTDGFTLEEVVGRVLELVEANP